jgi:RNA polymerase sigma-54 factor
VVSLLQTPPRLIPKGAQLKNIMLPIPDLSPRPAVAPSLVLANQLLGCNWSELVPQLLLQAADNPALQLVPVRYCPRCGFPLAEGHVCALCTRLLYKPSETPGVASETSDDWEERLSAPDDFRHDLLTQARLELDRTDHAIAEFIIAALDEHGLLSSDLLGTLPQRAERVLRVIQSLDPPGIAARNTAECFHLQLVRLDQTRVPPAVYRLVEKWPALPEHYPALARTLQITTEELDQALAFMRAHLRPYPIMDAPDPLPFRRVDIAILLAPDSGQIQVIIAPGPQVSICTDPTTLGQDTFSPEEWHTLAQHGHLLERALAQRQRILQAIYAEIAHKQAAFLLEGLRQHKALTRAEIARAVGVHASTVGRAAANKSVLIPSNQVVPAALFFERGAAIKHAIREIVVQDAALTDEQVQEQLAVRDIIIARRTVAKYRAAAGILPVHLRWTSNQVK